MTQEERQLLFKDLCARLPYKPYLEWDDDRIIELNPISYETIARIYFQSEGNIIRPYLRSMSSMTEEEKEKERKLWDIVTKTRNDLHYLYTDFLLSHHIDYRGLIPMGLAIEAPENMYNNTKTE